MTYAVHPTAARYQMLPADELQALADDIKTNGQIHPIIFWHDPETGEELLIDGRNRAAACEMIGIEPKAEIYEGNPYAFIRSANNRRRHLTPGQQAAADAFELFDQGKRVKGRWKYGSKSQVLGKEAENLRQCGVILDEDPDLLQSVLDGSLTLPKAYEKATEKRLKKQEEKQQSGTLADHAPDLSRLIKEGELTLKEAWDRYQSDLEIFERAAKLPNDLADRVESGTLSIDEAETINDERENRLDVWAEKIDQALTTLGRMIGNPIPDGLDKRLTETRYKALSEILARTEGVHVDNL